MIELIKQPWPWYVGGPIIAIVYATLLYFGKGFGISASLRAMCSALGAGKRISFFNFDWRGQNWNFMFVLGAILGGFIAVKWLSNGSPIDLSESTIKELENYGISSWQNGLVPTEFFNWSNVFTLQGIIIMALGGFFIGFGSRYAGGCTSGHAISGLADLQIPSLVAVIGFFIGGLVMTWFILPYILSM